MQSSTRECDKRGREGNIMYQLDQTLKALKNKDMLSKAEIKLKILCLFHFIGDLHQPLHVGYGHDKAGNTVQLNYKRKGTNLHSFWDSGIFNLIGPLAKHLNIEHKHILKEEETWFKKYVLIIAIRVLMTIIYPLFFINCYIFKNKPIEPIAFEDKLNESLVKRLRQIGEYNNTAPTEKSTDEKIIEIYTLICTAFREASSKKQEHIPANSLNTIAMKFFKVYEEFGEAFMKEHLEYELNKYRTKGLRSEYKIETSLF
jgi:hypothetical protein